ncbi:MAG: PAS domain-containing protein [Deltaproteobacteria bacterium]|nr:PAS domain-containing protein [Deltaproteobacteria bacterium]
MAPGADPSPNPFQTELRLLLKVLMIFRIATVTLFLVATVAMQVKGSQTFFFAPIYAVYLVVVAVYLLTILFAGIFNQVRDGRRLAKAQIAVDLAIYTLIVYLTGGYESPFPFLFIFSILWSSLALRSGGYWTASFSAILYSATAGLMYYGVLSPPLPQSMPLSSAANPWDLLGRVGLNIAAFYAVGFLGQQMAKRYTIAKEALTEKAADLEKLQHLSDVVFESINSGIAVLDGRGGIRSMNSSAYEILGPTGIKPGIPPPPDAFGSIPLNELCARASDRQLDRWEGSFTARGGESRIMGLSISPLKEPEMGFVVIFQDLTELRHLEEKLKKAEKLTALGQMAASIAHEVRNPLASMSGSIQILKDSLHVEDENRKLMDIVLRETGRLDYLVGDFLTYARPPTPHFQDVDLRTIIEETVRFFQSSPESASVDIDLDLPAGPAVLSVDSSQIRQILINLLKNAVDSIAGAGRIEIALKREEGKSGLETILLLSDDGSGISEDILPVLFEPFKTTKERGSGLGLAIVYQLVEVHQGRIEVQSREGGGTVIRISLPPWRSE